MCSICDEQERKERKRDSYAAAKILGLMLLGVVFGAVYALTI